MLQVGYSLNSLQPVTCNLQPQFYIRVYVFIQPTSYLIDSLWRNYPGEKNTPASWCY
jgi:hypothetical protein